MGRLLGVALLLFLTAGVAASAVPARVAVRHGDIFCEAGGASRQLTSDGINGEAVLGPDGVTIAFTRTDARSTEEGMENSISLWKANGLTGHRQRLLAPKFANRPEENLLGLESPVFSSDGKYIYVIASAWVTSGAVHRVDLEAGREHFVIDGNSLKIIRNGPYAGHLLIERHRYRPNNGGSFNPTHIVTPAGKMVLQIPGTEIDDGVDRATPWLQAKGYKAW